MSTLDGRFWRTFQSLPSLFPGGQLNRSFLLSNEAKPHTHMPSNATCSSNLFITQRANKIKYSSNLPIISTHNYNLDSQTLLLNLYTFLKFPNVIIQMQLF